MKTFPCLKILFACQIFALIACSQTRFDDERSQRGVSSSSQESAALEKATGFRDPPLITSPILKDPEIAPPPQVEDASIPLEPAVSPGVVAGASLRCLRDPAVDTSVDCQATVQAKSVDLVPDRIYVFDESIQFWIETSFKRIHVGRYKISVYSGLPQKIPLALSYGNGEIIYSETEEAGG